MARDVKGIDADAADDSSILAEQVVAITAGSVQSAAYNADTKFVRICADAPCSIKYGSSPTATASTRRLPANWPEYFGVQGGNKHAVITNT